MSRERELLKEFIDFVDSYEFYPTERSMIWEIVSRTQELLAQPEQNNTQYLLDQVARLTAENAMLKEKWSTPKPEREPVAWMNDSGGCFLSDGNKYSENWTALYTAPPKREPLTPQKISEGNQSTLNVTREAFKQGVKFAEKAHGITGVDDDN